MTRETSVQRETTDESEHARWLSRGFWLFKEAYRISLKWLFLPLLGALVGTFFISRIVAAIRGPADYNIYVVGDLDRPATHSILEAFEKEQGRLKLGDVDLGIQFRDDHGDPEEAKRIAAKLARSEDTLLVVGHIISSQTKLALPSYLGARPRVPVILAVETTPNLAPEKLNRSAYYPIFRLSPTDDLQVQRIAKFIKGARAVWVVEDTSNPKNPLYSSYLAHRFIREAQKQQIKVVLWSSNLSPPTAQAIRDLKIDWIFFAGRKEDALILIHQLDAMDPLKPKPSVILSDASANQDFIDSLSKAPDSDKPATIDSCAIKSLNNVEEVYVASQVTADAYNKEAGISACSDGRGIAAASYNKNAGYSIYGARAVKVVQLLLERAADPSNLEEATHTLGWTYRARKLLGIQRVQDARTVLITTMKAAQDQGQQFMLDEGTNIRFGFDSEAGEDGVRKDEDATFYIWRLDRDQGIFVDARGAQPLVIDQNRTPQLTNAQPPVG
jgi:branched-chain amino acid transport system substrate-binding protein